MVLEPLSKEYSFSKLPSQVKVPLLGAHGFIWNAEICLVAAAAAAAAAFEITHHAFFKFKSYMRSNN